MLSVATAVFALISIMNQKSANHTAVRIEKQAQAQATANLIRAGNETDEVYLTQVQIAKTGLSAAIKEDRELQEYGVLEQLDPSVSDGVAMLSTKALPSIIRDLGLLSGQMRITYGSFAPVTQHVRLRRVNLRRACRTILFANQVELDLQNVPATRLSKGEQHYLPPVCKTVLAQRLLASLSVSPATYSSLKVPAAP